MELKNWLQSSQSPEQIANTVRGAVLLASGVIVVIAHALGLPILDGDVAFAAGQLGAAAGGLWFVFGLIMKGVMFIGKK